MFYKYGGKQLYYFNTFDGQGEIDISKFDETQAQELPDIDDEANCDSCVL
jgi:hypothetical protein